MIPASLYEGPVFYFYVESLSSHFMHQLGEHVCHSEYNVHCPKILLLLMHVYNIVVFEIIISSHHLNFGGALAFMFCYTIKGKRDTILPCLIMIIAT